tara:strand:- start:693 stop:1118 length:426 start_codon:yes stop_codon:yes gene_type:complete
MKDNLIEDLENVYHYVLDYRTRFLNVVLNAKKSDEFDENQIYAVTQLRYAMAELEDHVIRVKESIGKRVYCVQVTSNVDTTIKVLAKNEKDALEWACEVADNRISKTLGKEHDCDYYSTGDVMGDKSLQNDEADEEYEYDE